jgi:hypothetical protein
MASSEDTLETISGKIKFLWDKHDNQRATLAVLVAQAKRMVEENSDPEFIRGRSWKEFAFQEFDRTASEVRKLIRMGNSPDPVAAHEEEKRKRREQMQALRQRQQQVAVPRGTAPDVVEAFVQAWSVIPTCLRDEALRRIGAQRATAEAGDGSRGPNEALDLRHAVANATGLDDVAPSVASSGEPAPVAAPEPTPALSADDEEQPSVSDPGPSQPGGDEQSMLGQVEETGPTTTALPGASAAVPEAVHGGGCADVPEQRQHSHAAVLSPSNDGILIDSWYGRRPPPEVTCNNKRGVCGYGSCGASRHCLAPAQEQVAA